MNRRVIVVDVDDPADLADHLADRLGSRLAAVRLLTDAIAHLRGDEVTT